MSWGRKKSRVSLRNLLRNKKTAVVAAVCCVAVVGAYIGFHRPTSKAGNEGVVRGILSQTEPNQYGVKSFASDAKKDTMIDVDMTIKTGDRSTMGTAENPFLVLELVPWQGVEEMGYMIEGCEPVDIYTRAGCYNKEKAAYYRSIGEEKTYDSYRGTTGGLSWANSGAVVKECFSDEDYPGKGLGKDDPDYKYRWFHKSESKTIKGYYEKVAGTSVKGNHNITGVDDKGRPIFEKTEEGKGDFIWVSLGGEAPNYKFHEEKENKPAFEKDASLDTINGAYAAGDREYTTRTEDEYWFMPNVYQVDEDGTVYEGEDLKPKSMFVHYNDFLRYTLRIKTKEEVDDYSIVVKPVEPTQLRDNPQYVDFADLIWIHKSSESGIASNVGVSEPFEKFMNDPETGANQNSTFFDANNDIGWEVAEKLYFKANGLTKYSYDEDGNIKDTLIDYSGDGQYAYAPVVMAKTLMDEIKGGETHNNTSYYVNYDEMTINKNYSGGNSGRENNFYKFVLMDTLMDQDVFYDLFYTPTESTNQPVIQTIDGKGYNTIQEGDAQTFWCPQAFLPYFQQPGDYPCNWGSNTGKDVIEKYKIYMYGGAFLNFPGEAILTYTYIYNSNNTIFVLGTSDSFGRDEQFTSGVHEWFDDRGEGKDKLSPLDIIFFLLNYEKGGNNTTGSRRKKSIRSLEIEPSNDFYLNETSLKALFPKSKYLMEIEPPVHMTTAEFNGSKIDLSEYDLVYIGTCRGKMNTAVTNLDHGSLGGWFEEDDARYNDANLTSKLYLHVGDTIKNGNTNYRLAGTDIISEQVSKLKSYVNSGNVLMLADVLYYHTGTSLYQKNVDISSNINKLIEDVNSKDNVVSLTKMKTSNVVSDEIKGAAVAISTPKPYVNIVDSKEEGNTAKATLNGNKLSFSFTIGYPGDKNVEQGINMKYGVRLYVDTNGDGIITEAEDGSEVCSWDSDAQTGAIYEAGTKDENGKIQEKEYQITYTVASDRTNGAIAWKFEVFSIDNENIKTVTSGVSRYEGKEDQSGAKVKNKINVLQVIPSKDYEKSKANLEEELKKSKSSSLFAKYAKDLDDYEITVTTIPLSKSGTTIEQMGYLDAFQFVNSDKYDNKSNSRENFSSGGDYYYPSAYAEYGVYLFSCGKEFEKADNSNGAVAFASWLSENGRSVIYTANSIYDAENDAVNGVAKLLKDSAGLSRYTSTSDSTKKYNDVASYTDKSNAAQQYSSKDYNAYKDLEYTYNKLTETGQSNNQYLPFKNEIWKKKDGSAVSYGSKAETTDTLSQINKGTVCVYPYTITDPSMDILDRFESKNQVPISGYSSQDYQLNLVNPMADVWYCLSGDEDTTYGISPNDAWNNYYLYNVDNVFYDGISLENGGTTKLEMQLFINILIGAYEASYKYPYITADKLEILPNNYADEEEEATEPTEDELKIELLGSTDQERNYKFSVSGVTSEFVEDYRYREYKAGSAPIAKSSSTPKPTKTPKPTATPTPTDPNATPVPTATPAPTPITLYENSLLSPNVGWESDKAEWMKGLSNDAVIQIAYRTVNRVGGSEYVLETRGNNWSEGKKYTACTGDSTNSTDIQIVRMTIKEFKQSFNPQIPLSDDIQYVKLFPYGYWNPNIILLSVRLYGEGMDFEDINDPSGGTGSGSGNEEEKTKREEDVTGTDFIKDTDTHKIYFTPHDGNLVGANIRRVKMEFVSDKNNNENTLSQPINDVFREKKSGTELKTYQITSEVGGGLFAEEDNKYLVDSKQYFIPFNKTYVNLYSYIKMTIWNKKRSSVTYIAINDQVTQKTNMKDVYMFNLD